MVTALDARSQILSRLKLDLIGPKGGLEESIDERPSARYLTGILYPQKTEFSDDEDEAIASENGGGGAEEVDEQHQATSLFRAFKPATCGFSFSVRAESDKAELVLQVRFGRYEPSEVVEPEENAKKRKRPLLKWTRIPYVLEPIPIRLVESSSQRAVSQGLELYERVSRVGDVFTVTLQFINAHREIDRSGRKKDQDEGGDPLIVYDMISGERASFFQFEAEVSCGPGCSFVARPRRFKGNDEDEKIANLIYRDLEEYAVGHTASAQWTPLSRPTMVSLAWFPTSIVKRMDAAGDAILSMQIAESALGRLHALEMASASSQDLIDTLTAVGNAYSVWISERRQQARHELADPQLVSQAQRNLDQCDGALARIREGIALLRADPRCLAAFRLANRAMYIQAAWGVGRRAAHREIDSASAVKFEWRPFQIAFALMCLPSAASRSHKDRDVFDLIWFPTGGGKTDAYLLLAAFVLFFRRMAFGEAGLGVGVLMRYTLRTLTVQQFQRAAALILACEQLRLQGEGEHTLGVQPFSIGLWVGSDSTPNSYAKAVEALNSFNPKSTPQQLTRCPVCRSELAWRADDATRTVVCECPDPQCRIDRPEGRIGVKTVDDDIYNEPPSILIGTVDKFAQIVRKAETGTLFGTDGRNSPPELIIQDELHLIGGPLGSLTGLYECAIDRLCRTADGPAKIVGSTATIRRADEQIKQVFDRRAFQFPPPALHWSNSCFAKVDETDPGRLYVGITTAGRSEKFALQATSASLLQAPSAPQLSGQLEVDAYKTLVAYFNSLKVLGGALVLMEDDVRITVSALAQQWGEPPRSLASPEELTSRKPSSEIPYILERLNKDQTDPECVDILLASNMLSVGVDIPRLGLMLVNGQPKFMSEYIQATSRVGRRAPGLVVTIYNNNKIRDRAHYESFASWHSALYRSVEPSSVTPFAPRARDKALHAPFVALVRHLVSATPGIQRTMRPRLMQIVDIIVSRIGRLDATEARQARDELTTFVDNWLDAVDAGRIRFYWNDKRFNTSLLMSAEEAAARRAVGRGEAAAVATPNSVRNVEPSTDFILRERV